MHLLQGGDGEHGVLHDFGGEGPPLLLTHGNGLNAAMWTTVLPVLQRHRHCFGLDFRGHGASRTQSSPLDVERSRLVTEILLAVAVVGDEPIDAVGHSLGGATLVRTELENPGMFRRMWLFEPVMVPEEYERPDGDHPLVIAAPPQRVSLVGLFRRASAQQATVFSMRGSRCVGVCDTRNARDGKWSFTDLFRGSRSSNLQFRNSD